MHRVTMGVGDSGCSLGIRVPEPVPGPARAAVARSPPQGGLRGPTGASGVELNTAWVTWSQAGSSWMHRKDILAEIPASEAPSTRLPARPPPPATQTPKY